MSIVVLIAGLMMGGAADAYKQYMARQYIDTNNTNQAVIRKAIEDFAAANNRLPCVADPSLPRTDPNYGKEIPCTPADPAVGGTTRAPAARALTPPDFVRVGAVPARTLNLPIVYMAGPNNFLYIYAVTEDLTVNHAGSQIDVTKGGIDVVDGNGASLLTPPGSAIYLQVNPGKDGLGAYTVDGKLKTACAGSEKDVENCNGDATFISASYSNN